MTEISDEKLRVLNKHGFIPGPNESSTNFMKRVETYQTIGVLKNIDGDRWGFYDEDAIPTAHLKQGAEVSKELWDIEPCWIHGYYNNRELMFWNGGTTWLIDVEEMPFPLLFFQLNKSFSNSKTLLGIYNRDEILAHEMAHVGRAAFPNSKYEEIFAYQSSKSFLRRLLAPVVQSSKEVLLFASCLAIILFMDATFLMLEEYYWYGIAMWAKLVPCGMIAYALGRLFLRRYTFRRCQQILRKMMPDAAKINFVMYRLDDNEILAFSKMTTSEIACYVDSHKDKTLRWRLIVSTYFDLT